METEHEPSVAELSLAIRELTLGMKWFLGMFLVVASVPNVFTSLSIVHFQLIFMDALPGKPLPGLTLMFIECHWFFLFLTFVWPIAGLALLSQSNRVRVWAIGGVILIFVIGLQISGYRIRDVHTHDRPRHGHVGWRSG